MHERLFTKEFIAHVQDRRMVRERVEGFQALELIQDGPIAVIAFHEGAADADAVHQCLTPLCPSVPMADLQEISTQFVNRIGIN